MRSSLALVLFCAATIAVTATSADAACSKLAFTVNDYGKEGPTRDAKNLLDKHIAKWATDNNVKKYTAGPKEVSCTLFLDFGVFDEWTCRAESNVCWGGSSPAPVKPVAAVVDNTKK